MLHSELSDLGSLRTAPYLAMFASSNFGGWLGDALVVGQQFPVVSARRVVNSIGELSFQKKRQALRIVKGFEVEGCMISIVEEACGCE